MADLFQYRLIDADRWVEAVDRTWPVVELIVNHIELLLAVGRQVGALGQVLPDEPIDVYATAALPQAVRITEVDLDARVGRQLPMPDHLLDPVIGLRLAHRLGNAVQLGRKAFQRLSSRGIGQLGQHHLA